jgi:hypothetical protein
MLTLAVFCGHAVLMIAAMLVVGRKPVQWGVAALFLASCFLLEWFAPVSVLWRAILALGGVDALVATITVAALATPQWSAPFRLLQALTAGYRVRAGPTQPVLSLRLLGCLILEGLVIGTACLLLVHIVHAQLPVTLIALCRLLAGMVLVYALGEFTADLVRFGFLASGTALRPIHETPVAARSLRDFWGKRWNRTVSAWLYRFCFRPLVRRRHPNLGVVWAFFVSGALHAWVPLVALGASAALSWGAFFCLQGVFVLVEDALHVPAWPVPLARVWTLAILLATSPLFVYPLLSLLSL